MKVRIGISLDREVMDKLEEQVRASPDLSLDRSEIVNAVMKAFFRVSDDHKERTREVVTLNRAGYLKIMAAPSMQIEKEQRVPMMKKLAQPPEVPVVGAQRALSE